MSIKVTLGPEGPIFEFLQDQPFLYPVFRLPDEIRNRLTVLGLAEKLRDSYAGRATDPVAAFNAAEAVWNRLLAGEWSARRSPSASKVSPIDALVQAFREVVTEAGYDLPSGWEDRIRGTGKDDQVARKYRARLRQNPEIRKRVEEILGTQPDAVPSVEDLLNG